MSTVSILPHGAERGNPPRRYLLDGRELTGSLAVRLVLDHVRRGLLDEVFTRLEWAGKDANYGVLIPHTGSTARAGYDRLIELHGRTVTERFFWRLIAQERERRRECPRCHRTLSLPEARIARRPNVGHCALCGPGPEEPAALTSCSLCGEDFPRLASNPATLCETCWERWLTDAHHPADCEPMRRAA